MAKKAAPNRTAASAKKAAPAKKTVTEEVGGHPDGCVGEEDRADEEGRREEGDAHQGRCEEVGACEEGPCREADGEEDLVGEEGRREAERACHEGGAGAQGGGEEGRGEEGRGEPCDKATAEVAPAPAKVTSARKGSPGALVVLAGEKPWTKDELAEVRGHLRNDVKRLTAELKVADGDLHDLMRDAGDGAGNDQADVGSSTFERDQEMTIVNNARDMLLQSQHALERIADGSYGVCENCGEPIGKMRLMAFPRATLCMSCKQREERR